MSHCRFPNCSEPAVVGSTLCVTHHLQRDTYRALKKGKRSGGILGTLSGVAAYVVDPRNPIGLAVGQIAANYTDRAKSVIGVEPAGKPEEEIPEEVFVEFDDGVEEEEKQEQEASRVQTGEEKIVAAWKMLGLNRVKSTADDVRQRQRKYAEILHSDKGEDEDAGEKLKEFNAAASVCIEDLKKRND